MFQIVFYNLDFEVNGILTNDELFWMVLSSEESELINLT